MRLELHPRQSAAFVSPATEILYGGAAGGGKSHLMRTAAIAWATDIPGLQVYLFRRLSTDLVKNHMEGPTGFLSLLSEWVDAKLVRFNLSDNDIRFWNGSKIFLCHCQHEKDKYKYQGPEFHVLMIDELTHFSASIYSYLRGRVRLGGLRVPDRWRGRFPRIVAGSNPGGVGHNWVKAAFIDGCKPMEIRRMPVSEGGMLRQYIPAKLSDNPTLAETDPLYIDRLAGLGSPELVRAMKDGDWDIVSGGMFDDVWRRDTHVIKPFKIPDGWVVDRAFDWGSSKPFSVLWFAEADGVQHPAGRYWPRGTLVVVAEWYGWNGMPDTGLKLTNREIARGIIEREAEMKLKALPGPADSAIFSEYNGSSVAADMAAEGVVWVPADKRPGSRILGWEAIRQRLKAGMSEPMEAPGLFVFDNCQQFIRTVPVLPRDENKPDDVDTGSEDHVGDCLLYRCGIANNLTTGWDWS